MNYFLLDLNKDQVNGLAQLCFDLAKGAFAFLLIPAVEENPLSALLKVSFVMVTGLAFTYFALLLLQLKERVKE